MANLIFDFDGTLADSFPLIADAAHRYADGDRPTPERIHALRRVPLLQAVRELGVKPWAIPFCLITMRRRMYARMVEVDAFPGIPSTIRALYNAGHRLFILSSNRENNIRLFLAEHQLESQFEAIYHCSVFRKGAGVKKIVREKNLAQRSTYYIGNEAADIDDAQHVGIQSVAVRWSGQDSMSLARALPSFTVDEPRDLVGLFTETA